MKENQTIAQFLGLTIEQSKPFIIKNERGQEIYYENSKGIWWKEEFNEQGKSIFFLSSEGVWSKNQWNEQGKNTRFENHTGHWRISEYNEQGEEIFCEDKSGIFFDHRPKPKIELTLPSSA
jgi:hypothetical protein